MLPTFTGNIDHGRTPCRDDSGERSEARISTVWCPSRRTERKTGREAADRHSTLEKKILDAGGGAAPRRSSAR
jgi:hypothetical protein